MNGTHARGRGIALVLALGIALPTLAEAGQARPFAPLPTLSGAEMASLRGGLEVAGLNMDLTAELRTYINKRLALATQYHLSRLEEGRRMVQTRLREGRQRLHSRLETAFGPDGTSGGGQAAASPSAPRVNTVTQGQIGRGTVTVTDSGITTVTHTVSPDQILSTVATTANDQQIRQKIQVDLTVHNFHDFASRIRMALDARRIGRAASGGF